MEQYSFIDIDNTIVTKELGEIEMKSMRFELQNDGVFKMLTLESTETSVANEWGTVERLNDLNQFAAEGIPILKTN